MRRVLLAGLMALALPAASLAAPPPPASPQSRAAAEAASCPEGTRPVIFAPVPVRTETIAATDLRLLDATEKLAPIGAVRLTSDDEDFSAFTSISGLRDAFVATTAGGWWIKFGLDWREGNLHGLSMVAMAPILDEAGKPVGRGPTSVWQERSSDVHFAAFPEARIVGGYALDRCGPAARRFAAFSTPQGAPVSVLSITDYSYGFFAGEDRGRIVTAAENYAGFGVAQPTVLKLEGQEVKGPRGAKLVSIANPFVIVPVGLVSLWRTEGRPGLALRDFDLNRYMHFGSREQTADRDLGRIEGLEPTAIWGAYTRDDETRILLVAAHTPGKPREVVLMAFTLKE